MRFLLFLVPAHLFCVCNEHDSVTDSDFECAHSLLVCRYAAGLKAASPASYHGYGFDENTDPNSHLFLMPETEDAKSERIRQLHLTLGALIDERDELQDSLSSSASLELAQQLEHAQAELQVLRKYHTAGSHTSNRTRQAGDLERC